ncbi:helix-turn-helix domain-containing protein [Paenarthrobacter sp. Z7-10]|uniref:PucR family transcriptional regulator n=1 Tax=Paenarthrobacter sp. Z7-10 TaxID=2787635 RepID=UPI0022A9F067|nr:PucR family transcriptional regulator [Paenarthrobacter sp. Z7-10]MCZ2401658.1 helix-turn-helix domain-containing protein [Paenarthrobacter sp. Z7-10]
MPNVDVELLVEAAALKLGRGLSLEDLDGVLLAYSSNQSHADRVRVNFLLSKRVPLDVSAWQLSHGIAAAVRPVVVPANSELGMLGRVCVPLLVRGFRVGYLWVQQDAAEQSATAILAQLPQVRNEVDLLASLLLDSNTAESEHRRRREQEFLAACAGGTTAIANVADWTQVHGRGPWQLVTALEVDGGSAAAGADDASADPLAATLIHRSAALQASIGVDAALFSAGTDTHAVLLFRESAGRASHAAVLVRYQLELAKRSGRPVQRIILGISESFADPRRFPQAFLQSKLAAQAAAVDPQLGELVDCRSTGVYQLLAAGSWEQLSSVHFRTLADRDRNAELLPVLELLYDNNSAVQDVADRLHLHRSSVYNRLARIRALIGADPLHGQVRLELHLALKARRWARRPRI